MVLLLRRALIGLLLFVGLAPSPPAMGAPVGLRGDGSGVFAGGPRDLEAEPTWRVTLPAASSSQPVVAGGRVFVISDPNVLSCLDAKTGSLLWEARIPVAAQEARVEERREAERWLTAYRQRLQVARSDGHVPVAELLTLTKRVDEAVVAAGMIGEATAPSEGRSRGSGGAPLVDGDTVYAVFGVGSMGAWSVADGSVKWTVELGDSPRLMKGAGGGTRSSPQMVNGKLIVAQNQLRALNPVTGAVEWESVSWPHYGQPVPMQLEGGAVLFTPFGEVIRVSDGVVAHRMGMDLWYVSPVTVGNRVIYAGGQSDVDPIMVRAFDVSGSTEKPVLTEVYERVIDAQWALVSDPVVFDGRIHLLARQRGGLYTFDVRSGRPLSTVSLQPFIDEAVTPLAVSRGRLFAMSEKGQIWWVSTADEPEILLRDVLKPTLSGPFFTDGALFVRTKETLYCFGQP